MATIQTNYQLCLLSIVFFSLTLSSCTASATPATSDPSGPNTKTVLCHALGEDPNTQPLCSYRSDRELNDLLESVFPIGLATQADVRAKLGIYLLSTKTIEGGVIEYYAIEETLFPDTPIKALFMFDSQGVLRLIEIVDIL